MTNARKSKNIVLVGMMGCGKTTVSNALARLCPEFSLLETDELIENSEGMTINEIFAQKGEAYFRSIENKIIREALSEHGRIISPGGGVFLNDENKQLLNEKAFTVYLSASSETLYNRLKNDNSRPLLKTNKNLVETIKNLLEVRTPHYKKAMVEIVSDNKSAKEIAEEILKEYKNYGN